MHECDNAAVRDLLPDLLGDARGAALSAARDHVASCEACRAELELLAAVRKAVPAPRVDPDRIAAAIPAYRPVPRWERVLHAPAFRLAAAIVLVAGLGSLVRHAPDRATPDTADARPASASAAAGELSVGAPLGELSEADLRDLLSELGHLEAVTSTDADVVVIPAVDRNGA